MEMQVSTQYCLEQQLETFVKQLSNATSSNVNDILKQNTSYIADYASKGFDKQYLNIVFDRYIDILVKYHYDNIKLLKHCSPVKFSKFLIKRRYYDFHIIDYLEHLFQIEGLDECKNELPYVLASITNYYDYKYDRVIKMFIKQYGATKYDVYDLYINSLKHVDSAVLTDPNKSIYYLWNIDLLRWLFQLDVFTNDAPGMFLKWQKIELIWDHLPSELEFDTDFYQLFTNTKKEIAQYLSDNSLMIFDQCSAKRVTFYTFKGYLGGNCLVQELNINGISYYEAYYNTEIKYLRKC